MKGTQKTGNKQTVGAAAIRHRFWFFHRAKQPVLPQWDALPSLLTIGAAAGILGVHANTLRAWDKQGALPAVRIGSRHDRRYEKTLVRSLYDQRCTLPAVQKNNAGIPRQKWKGAAPLVITGMGILVVLVLFAQPAAHADMATSREYRLRPQTCEGWQGATNATSIQLPPVATSSDFSVSNSAVFHADEQAVTTNGQNGDVVTGTLDQHTNTTITCSHFTADGMPAGGDLADAKITLSFLAVTAQNSTDVFIVEGSTNSKDWFPLATFPDREHPGSYTVLPFNELYDVAQVNGLTVRIRADATSYSVDTRAALDGIEIVATVVEPIVKTTATPTTKKNYKQLDSLVSFSQGVYQRSEQPIISVPKKRVKKFLFFSRREEVWSLNAVKLTDLRGQAAKADYRTQDVTSGSSTATTVTLDTSTLHPGRYTVAVTMTSPSGSLETVKKDFVWGVIAMNVTKAVARPLDAQEVDVGVLDDGGRTVCNAEVTLTVTDPHGKSTKYATRDKSMKASGACVDKGVTNTPDYSAQFIVGDAGLYHLRLQAKTPFGTRQTEENFTVETSNSFIVHRVDFPTRINPTSSYPVRIAIVPLRDFSGIVSEHVPANIAVSAFQPDATVRTFIDNPGEQVVEWQVDWKAGKTYFLSYTFDTPDVSPALFTLGPLSLGGSFTDEPLFREPRRWELASDSIVQQQQTTPTANQQKEKDRFIALAFFIKTQYRAGEKPVLHIPKSHKRQGFFAQGSETWKIKKIEVRDPRGEIAKVTAQTADVAVGADTDAAITFDANAFHPGKNTVVMDVAMPDGSEQTVEKEVLWGVVAVNVRQSVLPPNTPTQLMVAVLNDYGSTVCDSNVDITVTDPAGKQQKLSTVDGTVTRNASCAEHSVTNDPDYSAQYSTTVAGTYNVHVHATTKDGTRDVDDSFSVQDTIPFDVERTSFPTRTYPPASYPVNFTIIPKQDFTGTVTETLPSSFYISTVNENGIVGGTVPEEKTIVWTVHWKAGESHVLSYTFQGPPVSPMLFTLGPLRFVQQDGTDIFQESRQWQIASDATRTWDGGGGVDTNWSTATNWSPNIIPGSTDAVVFSSASSNNNSVWDTGVNSPSTVASITSTASYSGTLTMNQVVSTVSGAFNWASGGLTISSTNTLSVGGNFTLTTSGTFTANTSSVKMSGTSNTFNSAKTFSTINIDPSSAGTITNSTNAPTISAGLIVAASDTFSIDTSLNVILQSTATLTLTGTISGAGAVLYQNTVMNFPTTGTISSGLIFNLSAGSMTIPERTYGGAIRCRNPSTTARICKLATATGKTLILLSDLQVEAVSTANATVDGATYDPILNITGNISYVGTGSGTEVIQAPDTGSVTWTVSGSVDFTNGTYTKGTEKLSMNGTSKTLTSASQSLYDFSVSGGTVSIGDTTAITDNLTVTGGTLTLSGATTVTGTGAVSSGATLTINATSAFNGGALTTAGTGIISNTSGTPTTTISGTGDLGGGSGAITFYSLTVTTASTGTVTLKSDATVTNLLFVASGESLTLSSGKTMTLSGTSGTTLTFSGTINGPGRLTYRSSTIFPTTGTLASTPILRYDTVSTDMTTAVRTDYSTIEAFNSSSTNRTLTIGNGTHTLSANLDLQTTGTGTLALATDTNNPAVNVTGNVTASTASGAITLSMGSNTWTVSGDFDLTNVTTFNNNSGTLAMNGASKTLTSNSKTLYNFNVTAGTVAVGDTTTVANDSAVSTGATLNINNNLTVQGGDITNTGTGIITYASGTPTVTVSGTGSIGGVSDSTTFYNLTLSGTPTLASNISVADNLTLPSSVTAGTTTVTMTGTSATLTGGGATIYNLTVNSVNGTATLSSSDLTVSNNLTLGGAADGDNDTLTIASGRTLTLSNTGATALTIQNSGTDTINGPGRLTYQSSTDFPSVGTLGAVLILRFDMVTNAMNMPARTDYGAVEAFNSSASDRVLTMASGTHTLSGDLNVQTTGTGKATLDGAANPTVNVTGSLNCSGAGSGAKQLTTGTGTWTVSTNVDFSNCTPTITSGNTIAMNGTGTLTSNSNTLQKFTTSGSGTITLANATHTIADNLTLGSSATITAGTSTVTMTGTSKTIDGGGQTLNNLTISGTETLQNTDLTVSNTLSVAAAKTLTLGASRTLTHTGATLTWGDSSSTITGSGTLRFTDVSGGPGTGGTLSSVVRFDASTANVSTTTVDARTYGGAVEFYSNVAATRSITLPSGTFTMSSSATVITGASQSSVLTVDASNGGTSNPTMNITGALAYTKGGSATPAITTGTGTWTVGGSVTLTNGTFTATSGNTLVMNGSGTLTPNGNTLQNVTLSGTITLADATHTVAGDFSMAGGTITAGNSTVSMTGSGKTLIGGSQTLYNLTLDGDGTTTLQTSALTVSNTLNVTTSDTLSLSVGLTSSSSGSVTISGTISGSSILTVLNSSLGTGGTLSAPVTFDATDLGTLTVPNRTYGGAVVFTSGTSGIATSFTLGSGAGQTLAFSSTLTLTDGAPIGVTLDAHTYDPTVNLTGDLLLSLIASSSYTIDMTAGIWTSSGNINLTRANTFNNNSGTLIMNGGSSTLTMNSNTFHNLTLSGSVSLSGTGSVAGNLNMTGGTITAGTSTVTMTGTSKTIDGGGNTLKNLTISGTETLQNTDLTVSGTLTVNSLKSLTLNASRTLTLSASSGASLSLSGTINGPGRLTYQSTTTFPTGGTLAATLITRFDTKNGNMVIPARTDYGAIEVFGDSANARTVTLGTAGSQTITTSSYFYVIADATGAGNNVTLQGATYDPTLNVGTDFDFTGTQAATEIVTAPDAAATWTVSGNVNLTDGTWTAGAETLKMNGTTKTLTDASQNLSNFEVSGGTVSIVDTTTIAGNVTISGGILTAPATLSVGGNWNNSGGTFTNNSGAVTINGTAQQTLAGTMTGSSKFYNLTITNASGSDPDTSPSVIFSADATTQNTFAAATASTKIRFAASGTYTFQNISFNGQASGTRVALRSSTGGTTWALNAAGTRMVSNTDVKDSNACGQSPDIDATDGTNKDSGNNPCWAIAYLTVSLSPTDTVSLGALDTTNVNQASMTSTVTTTAAGGYVSTVYYNATLTSGLNTIPDADGSISPASSEFGASTDDTTSVDLATTSNSCATGTGTYNTTALSTTAKIFASESAPASGKVATLCFSAGISTTQAPGSYTSTMTLVTTGKY